MSKIHIKKIKCTFYRLVYFFILSILFENYASSSWQDLPEEVQIKCLSFMNAQAVLNFSEVSKNSHTFSFKPEVLKAVQFNLFIADQHIKKADKIKLDMDFSSKEIVQRKIDTEYLYRNIAAYCGYQSEMIKLGQALTNLMRSIQFHDGSTVEFFYEHTPIPTYFKKLIDSQFAVDECKFVPNKNVDNVERNKLLYIYHEGALENMKDIQLTLAQGLCHSSIFNGELLIEPSYESTLEGVYWLNRLLSDLQTPEEQESIYAVSALQHLSKIYAFGVFSGGLSKCLTISDSRWLIQILQKGVNFKDLASTLNLACLHSGKSPFLDILYIDSNSETRFKAMAYTLFGPPNEDNFREGKLPGFKASDTEATRLFQLVFSLEDKHIQTGKAFGAFTRGVRYHYGLGVDPNKAKALQHYLLCTVLATKDSTFDSYLGIRRVFENHLARLYEDENFEQYSLEKAAGCHKLAKEFGYSVSKQ